MFNLVSEETETRFLVQHESCEYNCRLDKNACNPKQKWNHDKCRCVCEEADDWRSCKYDYMWNASTCNSKCNKTS